MRKRTRIHEHWEDWIDSLSDADRYKLWRAIEAEREAGVTHVTPDEPRPTLH